MPLVVKSVDFDVWCLGLRVADYGPVDEHDGMVVSCADCVMAVVGHPCIDCEDVGLLVCHDHEGKVECVQADSYASVKGEVQFSVFVIGTKLDAVFFVGSGP